MSRNLLNMEIDEKERVACVSINPKIYPLDIVFSAGYIMLDEAYVVVNGDPEKELIVEISPKGMANLEQLGRRFNEELINYSVYKKRSEASAGIRQIILQRALLTSAGIEDAGADLCGCENKEADAEISDDDFFDDPEGIAVPWEEKYGKSAKTTKTTAKAAKKAKKTRAQARVKKAKKSSGASKKKKGRK